MGGKYSGVNGHEADRSLSGVERFSSPESGVSTSKACSHLGLGYLAVTKTATLMTSDDCRVERGGRLKGRAEV